MVSLTTSAIVPQLRPPPCQGKVKVGCEQASGGQLAILYVSLLLTALGAGGIRPSVVAFGADQFDGSDTKQKSRTWSYFNWYYFVMGASILVAVTVIVYIQDNVGWGWGLGIPTVMMFMSIVVFVLGYGLYRILDPAGSPFTRLVQVCVAAYRKRKLQMVSDPRLLYENDQLDADISSAGKLLHTKQLSYNGCVGGEQRSCDPAKEEIPGQGSYSDGARRREGTEPVGPEHGPPGGGAEIIDSDGTHLGLRHNPDHGLRPAGDLLPPTS
ncbi:hypothetical protein Dimus_014722 [Dionaea muscipula]